MMTSDASAEENRVTVRGLSQHLQLTDWQASWLVQGEILPPVHPLRGGNLLAVVRASEESGRTLVLWSKDGQELGRSVLDIAGEIKAAQVFSNRLLVATAGEIVEIATEDLRKVRARSFIAPVTNTTLYELCPTGLWLIGDKSVFYFDLDGRPALEKVRPLVAVDKPTCPVNWGEVKQVCSVGLQLDRTRAIASEAGDVIVVEAFKDLYPYAGRNIDDVWPSTATAIERNGAIISQKPWSWMKTRWEWFWFKEGSSHSVPAAWPQLGGLVRTRYEMDGISPGQPVSARGANFLFLNRAKPEVAVSILDRNLHTLWKKTLGNLLSPVVSPSWATPILLHDKVCRQFITINDRGFAKQEQTIEIPGLSRELWTNKYQRPRFAIGQSTEGDWLLIAY
jgi:hypothetical protein